MNGRSKGTKKIIFFKFMRQNHPLYSLAFFFEVEKRAGENRQVFNFYDHEVGLCPPHTPGQLFFARPKEK
jgi:hypothetical protein